MMTRQGSDREIIPGFKPVFDALRIEFLSLAEADTSRCDM